MKKRLLLLLLFFVFACAFKGHANNAVTFNLYIYTNTVGYPQNESSISITAYSYNPIKQKTTEKMKVNIYKIDTDYLTKWQGGYSEETKKIINKIIAYNKPVHTKDELVTFDKSTNYYQYKYIDTKFTPNKAGFYLVTASLRNNVVYNIFAVMKDGIIAKSDGENILVFVSDILSGQADKDVAVTLKKDKNVIFKGQTDENGLLKINKKQLDVKPEELTNTSVTLQVIAKKGEDVTSTYMYFNTASSEQKKAYLYTERPIYRPNQKIKFKAILRVKKDDKYLPVTNEEVTVYMMDAQWKEVYRKKLTSNSFGSIDDEFLLPASCSLGQYYLYLQDKGFYSYINFSVEEYRKPEYEVKIKAEKENYIQGEEIKFNVSAKYYFGEVLPNKQFTYNVYRMYYYPYYYYYGRKRKNYYYDYNYYQETVKTGTGTTNEKGEAEVLFTPQKLNYDAKYQIVVSMTDESRREVTGAANSIVTQSEFYLSLSTENYVYQKGDNVKLKITAFDYSEKPKANVDVFLEISKYKWDKDGKSSTETVKKDKVQTDANGITYYDFNSGEGGYYYITAYAFDKNENKTSTTYYVWVADDKSYSWYHSNNFEIILDKESYKVGDVAKVIIVSPYLQNDVLFTLEADKIYKEKVINFAGSANYLLIPIEKEFAPNVYVNISGFYNKQYFNLNENAYVDTNENKLKIKITTDKEKYQPAQQITYNIKALDYEDKPVLTELSLGIVDESIYALAKDTAQPIYNFFYGERYVSVNTMNSLDSYRYYYPGQYAEDDEKGDAIGTTTKSAKEEAPANTKAKSLDKDGSGSGSTAGLVIPEVRKEFADTLYFNPSILTDENGTAKVSFKLSDNLTTWRASVKAAANNGKVGEETKKTVVTKNLLVRLITPRFLTQRDEVTITAVVHNYLKTAENVTVKLNYDDGVNLLSPQEQKVDVVPDVAAQINWKIKVTGINKVKFTAYALTTKESDAMELTIPILAHGSEKFVAKSGITSESITEEINIPKEAINDYSTMNLSFSPSLASTILSSLEYLVGYPYGCVEQTMSRFLPNVIVATTLRELDITNETITKKLPDYVKSGLERLYDFHHSDGGWGWWKDDQSHPYMTAYVIVGLTIAKNAGFKIDENKINAGKEWLKKHYKEEKDLQTKTYILYSLSTAGEKVSDNALNLFKNKNKLNAYAKALLAIVLKKENNNEPANTIIANLEDSAKITGTSAFFEAQAFAHGWMDDTNETTAYCLKAFLYVKPESKLIPKLVYYLSRSRVGYSWNSTKDTAAALFALTDYLKVSQELSPKYKAQIYLNDEKIKEISFTKKDVGKDEVKIIIKKDKINLGKNKIEIKKEGNGNLYYSFFVKYYTQEENITSQKSEFAVERKYSLIKDLKTKKELPLPKVLKSGDLIKVALKITTPRENEYIMVEDPKPAGMEFVKEETLGQNYYYYYQWPFYYREVRDSKVAFFATYISKGTYTLVYFVKAETPGTFHTMPTKIVSMYFPEIGGSGNENIINIIDK